MSRLLHLHLPTLNYPNHIQRFFSLSSSSLNASFYTTLGVSSSATDKEIKQAFRKKSLQCHPDKFPNNKAKEQEFKNLSEAYQTLSDKKLRSSYDSKNSSSGYNSSAGPRGPGAAGQYTRASGYDPKTGRYQYRRPEDRFQYTYKAAGSQYSDRKYRQDDNRTQQQRSNEWSRVYEELNRQRHQEFHKQKKSGKADFSDFQNGRKSDRTYADFKRFYGVYDDTKDGGKHENFAREKFEARRFGTWARFKLDRLHDRTYGNPDFNHTSTAGIDKFIRGVITIAGLIIGYTAIVASLDAFNRDSYSDLERLSRLRQASNYHNYPTYSDQSVTSLVHNERDRIFRERLRLRQELIDKEEQLRTRGSQPSHPDR